MTLSSYLWHILGYPGADICRKESWAEKKEIKKGKCIHCGKWTIDQHKFTDDSDDEIGYLDWCCDNCYEDLQESL